MKIATIARSPLALTLALAFAGTFGAPLAASAAVPAGVTLNLVLATPDVNTKNAQVGDPVGFNVIDAPSSRYEGAYVRGHVADVRSAGQGRKAQLKLAFDTITYANGEREQIRGSTTQLQTVSENTTARKAIGAGAGMAVGSQTIGRIIGGSAGAVVGMLGGAAGGYAYANNDKANFSIVKGAKATIVTTQYQQY